MDTHTTRDRVFDGVAAVAIGTVPVAFAVALAVFDGGLSPGVALLALPGLAFIALGSLWISHQVTFSPTALSAASLRGRRTILADEVASVRLRRSSAIAAQGTVSAGSLVVRDRNGATIAIALRSHDTAVAAKGWLACVVSHLVSQWTAALAAGDAVSFGKRTQLVDDTLVQGKMRIQLKEPFSIEEIPASPAGGGLLRVTQAHARVLLEDRMSNYLPLREFLRRMH